MFRYKFSTREVTDALVNVVTRFPFVIAAALLGSGLGIFFIERERHNHQDKHELLVTGAMVCLLAVPFLLSLKLFCESRGWNKIRDWGLQATGVALMGLYWFMLPKEFDASPQLHWFRYAALLLSAHLLVSFAPFIRKGQNTEFWDFNQGLFFRWLIGAVYAGVLFAGIAAAMAAVDALFNVRIIPERYGELWLLCVGVFHPLFFLSGVPTTFANEDEALNFPKMLRWFCVYILVPIVIVYLVILYAYFGKIGIECHFPRGWVANLGLGFSVVGILALLLVYPVRERDDQPFIRLYYRWYFVALIPVIVLLFLAIGKRVSQYGFTEERYTVFALTCWLAFVAIYFMVVSRHRIKTVPISLFVICFVSAWLMFVVTRASQTSRLKNFLRMEKMLDEDGKIVKPTDSISDSSHMEISRITEYLSDVHAPKSLQPFFNQDVDSIVRNVKYYSRENALVEAMGISYKPYMESLSSSYFDYNRRDTRVFNVHGFDAMLNMNQYNYSRNEQVDTLRVQGRTVIVTREDDFKLNVKLPDNTMQTFDVKSYAAPIMEKYPYEDPPDSLMMMVATKSGYNFRLQFVNMSGSKKEDTFELDGYDAYLLIGTDEQ